MLLALVPWVASHAVAAQLRVNGSYRLRYESLDHRVRTSATGSDQLLAHRLLVNGTLADNHWYADAELEDARAWLGDTGTPLGTDDVNAAELLQVYAGFDTKNSIRPGDRLNIKVGRFTMNVGSRRLVARNKFRNTLNAFTGLYSEWHDGSETVQAFYTWPVKRRPTAFDALLHNEIEADTQTSAARFWGLFRSAPVSVHWQLETYLFGLNEKDTPSTQSRNRRLLTPGFRLDNRQGGIWHYEIEAALQFGHTRASASALDTTDLTKRAGFVHLSASRDLNAPWSPRLTLQYDYASGDRNPTDREDNRFDTLFGARRFEFGPTGIYGAFKRANISSPGVRLALRPSPHLRGFVGYRAIWLASARDKMLFGNDPAGNAGTFVGGQIEVRVRYDALPRRLRIEAGGAWLAKGSYLKHAASRSPDGNSIYGYIQATLKFAN